MFKVRLTDCKEIFRLYPSAKSGQYKIQLWKSRDIITVVCDMETDGGGWTVSMCCIIENKIANDGTS